VGFVDVVLAFDLHHALGLGSGLSPELDVGLEGNDLGADEMLLKIRVDLSGRLGCGGSLSNRPGANLLGTRGKESGQIEQMVGGADQAIETGFLDPEIGEKLAFVLVVEFRKLGLDLPADTNDFGAACVGNGFEGGAVGISVGEGLFIDVCDVENRFGRQQTGLFESRLHDVRDLEGAGGLPG